MRLKYRKLKWRGEELSHNSSWRLSLSSVKPSFSNLQELISSKLDEFGMAVVSDFPIKGKSDSEISALFQEYMMHIGCPVSQSSKLDFVGHVKNCGKHIVDHYHRGYESTDELPFHSDRCDLLCLLCVRQASSGGETRVVSAYSAFHALNSIYPEFAEILRKPIPFDLRDTFCSLKWALMPIFHITDHAFVARYVRRFIEASQRFDDAPRLTTKQIAALDALDKILYEPGMSLDIRLRPGELLILDNHRLFHGRTEFFDEPDSSHARLLLRSWLCWSDSPALPSSYAPSYARIEAGCYRGGVWPQEKPITDISSNLEVARANLRHLL